MSPSWWSAASSAQLAVIKATRQADHGTYDRGTAAHRRRPRSSAGTPGPCVLRIQVHPQRHRRPARITPGDDHPAGDGVLLPGLFHPGPDLLLERAVVSHAMSLAATLPRALIAWLSGD